MSARQAQADGLYDRVRSCTLCPLARTRLNAVPGEGPLDAEIMFIGEAPGVNEDRQGRPFVGAAGQFLEELLAAAGLKRSDVYICNVLKCRPPNNRDPLPGEIEACSDYLDEQVALINPAVIVTLGRYSMARYFPHESISRIHGQAREVDGRVCVPMYHPAAALHQQNLRATILNDFRGLPALLGRGPHQTPPQRAPGPAAGPAPVEMPATPAEPGMTAAQPRLFD